MSLRHNERCTWRASGRAERRRQTVSPSSITSATLASLHYRFAGFCGHIGRPGTTAALMGTFAFEVVVPRALSDINAEV